MVRKTYIMLIYYRWVCTMTIMHWVRLARIADRAPVYMDRTVKVMGLESVFEVAAWNGSRL